VALGCRRGFVAPQGAFVQRVARRTTPDARGLESTCLRLHGCPPNGAKAGSRTSAEAAASTDQLLDVDTRLEMSFHAPVIDTAPVVCRGRIVRTVP
jgi:hypothetical protein